MTQLQLLTTKEAICKGVLVVCTFTATHICNAHWGTRLSSYIASDVFGGGGGGL